MENGSPKYANNDSSKDIDGKEVKEKILTPKRIRILAAIICGNLVVGCGYSLMAPIFPAEAERKNASPTSYGMVFGVYQLVMFLSAPLHGRIMPRMKPEFMMKAGMFSSGCCLILFGFLDSAPAGPTFIALAATIRCVDAFGASAFFTASYTILACELSDIIGRAMSLTETAFCVGLSIGPVLGGVLFEVGGFRLPFIVLGVIVISGSIVLMFLFAEDDKDIVQEPVSILKLFKDIDFLIDVVIVSTCFGTYAFNEATLEPHVRQLNVTPAITGVIFLLSGLTDAVTSPFFGYIVEKLSNPQYMMLLGSILSLISYLLVGPVSFLPFKTNIWVVVFSQFILGLALAAEVVSCFTHGIKQTVKRGFPDSVGTYSMVSSLLFSVACFGSFVGPSIGGYMIDHIGYAHSTEVVALIKTITAFICASRLISLSFKKKNSKTEEK